MILDREVPWRREDLDETQLAMLRHCEVPGLLPLEAEETDGAVSFRYSLSGVRMLSEAMRTAKWTMQDLMNALCRLSEAMEECRLYLLDAEGIVLEDDFIFVGGDWQELRFTYLPLSRAPSRTADGLERLVIRWMMKVPELDGRAMQQVLHLIASSDFKPAYLRQYARQYVFGANEATPDNRMKPSHETAAEYPRVRLQMPEAVADRGASATRSSDMSPNADFPSIHKPSPPPKATSFSWKLLESPSAELSSASDLLGHDAESGYGKYGRAEPDAGMDLEEAAKKLHSWRWKLGCATIVAAAMCWRFVYLGRPNDRSMMISLCLTLIVCGIAVYFWNGIPSRSAAGRSSLTNGRRGGNSGSFADDRRLEEDPSNYPDFETPEEEGADKERQRFAFRFAQSPQSGSLSELPMNTTWLPSEEDRTALLSRPDGTASDGFHLVWESKGNGSIIPLASPSFVIGRSDEAAQHVDATEGISRAHLALYREREKWMAKDLGSRNGSKLNDRPMAPYELYELQPGDRLSLAGSRYRLAQQ